MDAITTINPLSPMSPVAPTFRIRHGPMVAPIPASRGTDDATSLVSGSSLRVRLADTHTDSMRLSETGAALDVADEALAHAQSELQSARLLIGNPDQGIDSALASVQSATGHARMGGAPILHDGATLRAGASALDIRPVSLDDLGAIIDKGRSHRLADLRSGGTLDARANPDAALRSADAALFEIASLRSDLSNFARSAINPAQRIGIAAFSRITGASPVTQSDPGAIRSDLLADAHTARRALVGSPADGVLRLLG